MIIATKAGKLDIRINGIASLIYGVDDIAQSTRYFGDFGLHLESTSANESVFRLPDSSTVVLRRHDDAALPATTMVGTGVRRVVWGLDRADEVEMLADDLAKDCPLRQVSKDSVEFETDFGIAMGLRVFPKRDVFGATQPSNCPGNIQRVNSPRRWRERAIPKAINHVVQALPDYERGTAFMCDRLGFRLSDEQVGFGKYLRAGGCREHHTMLLLNAHAHLPGMDGQFRFHHANFAVDDVDEVMTGANYMTRKGWEPSHFGLGRHRIDSALFYYMPCPAGGEAEYGADGDCVDDAWIPRQWPVPLFAYSHWVHNLPEFLKELPAWRINYLTNEAPRYDVAMQDS